MYKRKFRLYMCGWVRSLPARGARREGANIFLADIVSRLVIFLLQSGKNSCGVFFVTVRVQGTAFDCALLLF